MRCYPALISCASLLIRERLIRFHKLEALQEHRLVNEAMRWGRKLESYVASTKCEIIYYNYFP